MSDHTYPTWPTFLAWLENDLPDEESQLLNTDVADCDTSPDVALATPIIKYGDPTKVIESRWPKLRNRSSTTKLTSVA